MSVEGFRRAVDGVRVTVAFMAVGAPVVCATVIVLAYLPDRASGISFPLVSALGNTAAAYIPILSAVLGFLWAAQPAPPPPHVAGEDTMAWLRNTITVLVFGIALAIPIFLYGGLDVELANELMVAYHGGMHTVIAGGLVYYFGRAHVVATPEVPSDG